MMEQKRKNTFASYFVKKNNSCDKIVVDDHTKEITKNTESESKINECVTQEVIKNTENESKLIHDTSLNKIDSLNTLHRFNDIGYFVNQIYLSDADKYLILTNLWVPPSNYTFPLSQKNEKRKLRFQFKWLLEFNWLAYSEAKGGAFCKYCTIFVKVGGKNRQPLGNFVKTPFDAWKKAKQAFREHSEMIYHTSSTLDADHFLKVYSKLEPTIINRLDSSRVEQIKENRKRLIPIIECIILCGRQEIALRGHRDAGNIFTHDTSNQGNFRSILLYRSNGDEHLTSILQTPGRNKYITPQIQNEIISSCGNIILQTIVKKVNDSQCFSVLADETTDISVTEQLALCVRYIDKENNVNESFLKFIQVHSLSGKNLADSILNGLISCGIDCDFLYGQGYDGASNMSGQFQGVQAHIRSKYPKALYVHCAAHSLNLAVSTASNIKPVRNCLGIIEKLYVFFNTPKRNAVLLSAIENSNTDQKVKTLKRLCATRWVQRYDSVHDFIELFEFLVNALECITEWNDSSATDATLLLKSFDSEFIISVNIVQLMFSFGLPLCKQLQKINIDLKEAINLAQDTVDELKTIRNNCDDEFNNIFSKAKKMADKVEVELKYKRLGKRQTNRANPLTDQTISVNDYFKITVFISYIDFFISQLTERFLSHSKVFNGFGCLFSSNEHFTEDDQLHFTQLVEFYSPQVDKNNSLTELRLWRTKLRRTSCIPKTGIDALTECNKEIYPNIYLLLKILCTLPVSTTTPERMFSALKRVKTYLRNTMTEDRLNGLSMLAVHRDIKVSPEDVLDDIAKRPRKLDLVL